MAGYNDSPTGTGRAGLEPPADELTVRASGGVPVAEEPPADDALAEGTLADDVLAEELLVEEISIDGMCGVY